MTWAWLLEALLIINACLTFYLSMRVRQVSRLISVLRSVIDKVDPRELDRVMDALKEAVSRVAVKPPD